MKIAKAINSLVVEPIDDATVMEKRAEERPLRREVAKKRVRFEARRAPAAEGREVFDYPAHATGDDLVPVNETVLCLLVPSSEMAEEEKAAIWWQNSDCHVFRATASLISQEIKRRTVSDDAAAAPRGENVRAAAAPPSYALVVTLALEECRVAAASSGRVYRRASCNYDVDDEDEHEYDNDDGCCRSQDSELYNPLSKVMFAYLAHWSAMGHSRRGLEKWSVPLRKERFEQNRNATFEAVMTAQEEVRRRRLSCSSIQRQMDVVDGDDDVEMVSAASRMASRGPRMFALAMGAADALAVGYKTHDGPACGDQPRGQSSRLTGTTVERRKVVSSAA